jgi:hypothetical protein
MEIQRHVRIGDRFSIRPVTVTSNVFSPLLGGSGWLVNVISTALF